MQCCHSLIDIELSLFSYNQSSVWWKRSFKSDYLFSLTLDNQNLKDFVSKHFSLSKVNTLFYSLPPITNFPNLQDRSSYSASVLSNLMSSLRGYSDLYLPTTIIWALFFTGLLATLTMDMLFPDHPPLKAQADGDKEKPYVPPTKARKEETTARKRHIHRNKNYS